MSCPTAPWWAVLDDTRPTPPYWRLAYCLVGLPHPLPAEQWGDLLAAFEAAYGLAELLAGLRAAARQPPLSAGCGGPWRQADRDRAAALVAAVERRRKAVAA